MATTEILKTTNLQKSFSGIIAAEDINSTAKESEIIGIIGTMMRNLGEMIGNIGVTMQIIGKVIGGMGSWLTCDLT